MNRKFRTTTDIYHDITDKIMVGYKLPHDISLPVLCKIDGSFYIGVFVFFYTKEERDTMMIGRPTLWAIFDIKTGRLMEKYETCKRDFSDASYDKKYNITPDPEYMPDPEWTFEDMHEYFLNAFNDFDEIRKEIIEFKDYDPVVYRRYIDEILVTKYRKAILAEDFRNAVKQQVFESAKRHHWYIDTMETDKDHIHILLQYPPDDSVRRIASTLKQESTYYIWKQYPEFLKQNYWKEHTLWSDGYFVASIGDASTATIRKYIENQG